MSKGLEALERLNDNKVFISFGRIQGKKQFAIDVNIIEKELKALELLKENLVIAFEEDNGIDLPTLVVGIKVEKNKLCVIYSTQDKEKIDLLKEVLL